MSGNSGHTHESSRGRLSHRHGAGRDPRRGRGGIGPDGKPVYPIVITAVTVLLMLVAVYFGTVEGWFRGKDPASVEATLPPELTPQPTYTGGKNISALDEKKLNVFALDVGDGCCSLLVSPNGKTMLIDSGDAEHYQRLRELCLEHGIERFDVVIATSAEERCSGAMTQAAADFAVGRFYACAGLLEGGASALGKALSEKSVNAEQASPGDIPWDKSCTVTVLSPASENAEDKALLVRVEHAGSSFLFAGSLTKAGEDAALASLPHGRLKSTVLLVGRSGSDGAPGSGFVGEVSPGYAVISTGGSPANEMLAVLNASGAKLFRTDRQGTIEFAADKKGIKVN